MKKKLFGLLVASAALAITACGVTPVNPGNSSSQPGSSQPSSELPPEVNVRATGVTLNKNNVDMEPGALARLVATVAPANATNKDLLWSSSDAAVASVQDGIVTAHKKGQATITVKTVDGSFTDTCTVKVNKTYNITIKNDANVKINCALTKAEEGQEVAVSLQYDASKYAISAVKANNVSCGTKDSNWYFVMPAGNVQLSVEYTELKAPAVTQPVVNGNEGKVSLRGIAGGVAEVGSTVEFSFLMAPGYEFDGTVEATSNNAKIDVVKGAGRYNYSFVMPNAPVSINVGAEAITYMLAIDNSDSLIDSVKVNGEAATTNAKYGDEITVKLVTTGTKVDVFMPVGVALLDSYGEELDIIEADGDTVTFTMPHANVTIAPETDVRYNEMVFNFAEGLDLIPTVNIESKLYKLDEEGAPYGYQIVIIDNGNEKTGEYDGDTQVRQLTVEPFEYYSSYYGGTKASSKTSRAFLNRQQIFADGTMGYVWTLNRRPAEPIKFVATSKDMTKFALDDIAGSYVGVYLYGNRGTNEASSVNQFSAGLNKTCEIDSSGLVEYDDETYEIVERDPFTGETLLINLATENYMWAIIKDGVFHTGESSTKLYGYTTPCVRLNPGETAADITYRAESFQSHSYVAVEFLRGDEVFTSLWMDEAKDAIYLNPTFKMLNGTKIDDTKAMYEVKTGSRVLATVGYTGAGGVTNRKVRAADAVYGEFIDAKGSTKVITLDGFGHAKINNGEWGSIRLVSGNEYVLKADDRKITLALETTFKLFTIRTDEECIIPTLTGKTFAGDAICASSSSSTTNKSNHDAKLSLEFVDDMHVIVRVHDKYYSSYDVIGRYVNDNNTNRSTWSMEDNGEAYLVKTSFSAGTSANDSTLRYWNWNLNEAGTEMTYSSTSTTSYIYTSSSYYKCTTSTKLTLAA